MGSREDFKQEKDEGSRKIFGVVERFYSGGRYMEKERKLEECGGINKGIQTRKNRSEMTGENRKEER